MSLSCISGSSPGLSCSTFIYLSSLSLSFYPTSFIFIPVAILSSIMALNSICTSMISIFMLPGQTSSMSSKLVHPAVYMTSPCTYLIDNSDLPCQNTCFPHHHQTYASQNRPHYQLMATPSFQLLRPQILIPFSPTPYIQFIRKSY